jgi:flagellar basal body rod protein FlgB
LRTSVDAEIQRDKAEMDALRAQALETSAEARSMVSQELANVRTEVQKRIDTEFQSDNITNLVATAAKERTEKELSGIIRSETSTQVAKGIQDEGPVTGVRLDVE